MSTALRPALCILLALSTLSITITAQESGRRTPVVTATASGERVRFASLGEVNHTRLQVFSATGAQLYDSGFQLGNLLDWRLVDQQGTALSDGTYLFLITVRDFSSNLTQKYGTAILEQGAVSLEQTNRDELPQALSTALEANKQTESLSVVDRIGVNSSKHTAQTMPTDTAPISRPEIADSTKSNDKAITPGSEDIGGTGTQNQIAKWIDNSGNLGDSIITESGVNVGIDTTSPTQKLHVATGNLQIGSGASSHSMLLNYTGAGGGGDITAMMNGVEMLSFGFNNTGQLGGTAGTPSGRILYFYDRVAAQYRGGFNSVGEWYWGPTTGNYGLKVVQPNVGVQGVTVDAAGNVGIGTNPVSKLTVNGVVESSSGGVKFPDATTQTTAFSVPLSLTSSAGTQTISATNTGTGRAGFFNITNAGNSNNALRATTNGTGIAGFFEITNGGNSSSVLLASTNGTGRAGSFEINNASNSSTALSGLTIGTGSAGFFQTSNASNSSPALEASTLGTGSAGQFQISNASNSNQALFATTNGTGSAVYGFNTGTGRAGSFEINNAGSTNVALNAFTNGTGRAGFFTISNSSNTVPALAGETNGSGTAVRGLNIGTGQAGSFQINNASNTSNALSATTNGTGQAGIFQISNTSNASNALFASTNGTGGAVYGLAQGTGRAGTFETSNTSNASPALFAFTIGTGRAGFFQISNSSSTSNALEATTNAGNSMAIFANNTATTGSTSVGIKGEANSTAAGSGASSGVTGVQGVVTPTSPGSFSAGVRGINNGTGGTGIGVVGFHNGSGYGVYGETPSGFGVYGLTTNNTAASTGVLGDTVSPNGSGVQARYAGAGAGTALNINNGALKVTGANPTAFVHTMNTGAGGNSCGGNVHVTILDSALINGDPNAMVFVTFNKGASGPLLNAPLGVQYDASGACVAGRWLIYTLNALAIPNAAQFNVLIIKK